MTSVFARPVALSVAIVVLAACRRSGDDWTQRAVETLGAPDGYLFVVSPFNCSLRERQIATLNDLGGRRRRSARVLTVGHDLADSAVARDALAQLGIRMDSRPFQRTPLATGGPPAGYAAPVAIAVRGGAVVGVLSGPDTERLDEWVAWVERRPLPESGGSR